MGGGKKELNIFFDFGETSHAKCHRQIKFIQFSFVVAVILCLAFQNTPKQLCTTKKK